MKQKRLKMMHNLVKTTFDTKLNNDETKKNATLTPGTWPEAKENKTFDMKPGTISDPFEIQKDIFVATKVITKHSVTQTPTFDAKKYINTKLQVQQMKNIG